MAEYKNQMRVNKPLPGELSLNFGPTGAEEHARRGENPTDSDK